MSRYQLGRRLGRGGMAEVFLATAVGVEGFSRTVAIKRVLPALAADPAFAVRLATEARLGSILDHPNIVATLDLVRDGEGRLLLVMEHVDGVDLAAVLARGPLPRPVAIHVAIEILRGLGHAHAAMAPSGEPLAILHCDVSPSNVLVSWDGAVKLGDFGIAACAGREDAMAGQAGADGDAVRGKTAYMSPEQARGAELDARSDLFAVGVMLHEMVMHQRPFGADGPCRVPRPGDLAGAFGGGEVPADLEAVILSLLVPDRAWRTATAAEAIAALVSCRDARADGAEALARLLTERFGDERPVHRRHCGAPCPAPMWMMPVIAPGPPPVVHGERPPPITQTMPAPRAPRRWPLALAVAVMAGSAVWLASPRAAVAPCPPVPSTPEPRALRERTAASPAAAAPPRPREAPSCR